MRPRTPRSSKNHGIATPMSSLLTSPLVLASLTESMARQLYVTSSCASLSHIPEHDPCRVPPRKQPGISLRSLQFSLRTFPRSKDVLSIWLANHTVYVPVHFAHFDPHGRSGLQGRYIPLFASAVYDQNAMLVKEGLTPINLTSAIIGMDSEACTDGLLTPALLRQRNYGPLHDDRRVLLYDVYPFFCASRAGH